MKIVSHLPAIVSCGLILGVGCGSNGAKPADDTKSGADGGPGAVSDDGSPAQGPDASMADSSAGNGADSGPFGADDATIPPDGTDGSGSTSADGSVATCTSTYTDWSGAAPSGDAGASLPPLTISGPSVIADFGAPADLPLVKKFHWMDSRYVPMWKYTGSPSLGYLSDARMRTLRVELGWGVGNSFGSCIVCGSSGAITYDYGPLDAIATQMAALNMGLNVGMYWSYAYNPDPLNCHNDGIGTPCDINQWGGILQNMAAHWKSNGMRPHYQGVWNEPDNTGQFYSGDVNSFLPIYEAGSKGLRAGDADAVVGGPDLAVGDAWLTPLLNDVVSSNSPMDFLSFHVLGADNETRVAPKRAALKAAHYFDQTEMLVPELNPYNTQLYINSQGSSPVSDWPSSSVAMDSINYYLQNPEVTGTFWAQGLDAGGGDTEAAITFTNSDRRPVYWAHHFYGQMPVDRVQDTATGVSSFASGTQHVTAIMMWIPQGGTDANVTAVFRNVPFASGTIETWRIDSTHNSFHDTGHDFDPPTVATVADTADYRWTGTVPAGGVVLLKLYDAPGAVAIPSYAMGHLIRPHHYFYNRGDRSYGIFDPETWTARLGMSGNDYAVAEEGALYSGLPLLVDVAVQTEGSPHRFDNNSALSVNLDYRVNGVYVKSVMIHGGLYDPGRTSGHPFGKTGLPDQVVKIDCSSFTLKLTDYAPPGWQVGGDVLVSFTMQNTGAHSQATFTLRQH